MANWAFLIAAIGLGLTVFSLRTLRRSQGRESMEIKGLMQFSFGWQLTAVFGGLLMLDLSGMPLSHAAMALSSAISHFGLFAALQGGMFGAYAADLIPFIFAMPFLVHPLVFGIFGKSMEKDGVMPAKIVYALGLIGVVGVIYALTSF